MPLGPPPATTTSSSSSSCCACTVVSDADTAGHCLAFCGFALWPDAFESSVVDSLHEHYARWFAGNRSDVRRYLSYNERGGLRGRREQALLPSGVFPLALEDAVLHHRAVVRSHLAALRALGISGAPMLNFVTIMQSNPLSTTQDWHIDAPHPDGLKVQVPLIDVLGPEQGPLEIDAAAGIGKGRAAGCAVVRGVARRGAALMYRHVQPHRGTAAAAAAAPGAQQRVVLDISYMLPASVERDDYLARDKYPAHAAAAMGAFRRRAAELCAADALGCASVDAVNAVRGGPPYTRPLLEVAAEGWVAEYRGVGNGSGTWVDANGSVYEGDFVEGLCHGRGRYAFANGDLYEGEFRDDLRHGWGRFSFGDREEVWEGEWVRQLLHGRATVMQPGFRFEGEMRGGQPVRGRAEFTDGRVQSGDFKGGVVDGRCELTWPDGRTYAGECKQGAPHGRGTGLQHGALVFEGEWRQGQPHAIAGPAARDEATQRPALAHEQKAEL